VKVYVAVGLLLALTAARAKEPELKTSPLAQAFGSAPALWGARLSPDGSKISFIRRQAQGPTLAAVLDTATGQPKAILDGERDKFDITWCDWANDERLLCGIRGIILEPPIAYAVTRLVAVNYDGSGMRVLVAQRLRDTFTQFQDRVVDWLPGDDRHVLIQVPATEGSGVQKIDIYDGTMSIVERDRDSTQAWVSDGHGVPRLYESVTSSEERWYIREQAEQRADWTDLHRSKLEDLEDAFSPIGFADNRNELLYYDQYDGRRALFAMDLANGRKTRLVYSNPDVDVASVLSLGKFRRLVAVSYITDRLRLEFFDQRLADIHERLSRTLPGKQVAIFDENWNQRYYLVYAGSDQDPGAYYRFDAEKNQLMQVALTYPSLKGRQLSPMREIHYTAKDGTAIPAYLTLPAGGTGRKPAVILPHGGPSSRDYWSYDFLVQYFAANGYAVLQSNYRGSEGYGAQWQGAGGFKNWRVAIGDILDGADYLVKEGVADADRICTVGWSYGGYAALMSAIEQPKRFRCVVSIAGVTDPLALGINSRRFIGGRAAAAFIGVGTDLQEASPIKRAAELSVPVLLAHGQRDLNVPFTQSQSFARTLARVKKNVEFIEYEFAEHSIEEERYRIDLLTRVGDFLSQHLGAH
jgi:dipeptidyl aminopeptidase/acylaminoacyl peptidase